MNDAVQAPEQPADDADTRATGCGCGCGCTGAAAEPENDKAAPQE